VVRGGEVQHLGTLAEQVQDVLVAGDDAGGGRLVAGQVLVDAGEELGELAGPGSGGHDAALVAAVLGEHDLQVPVGLILGDLSQESGGRGLLVPSRVRKSQRCVTSSGDTAQRLRCWLERR
jgi:hypothetical protein